VRTTLAAFFNILQGRISSGERESQGNPPACMHDSRAPQDFAMLPAAVLLKIGTIDEREIRHDP